MAKNSSFYEYVMLDVFDQISGISSRSMFGGYGFYYYGKFFAIISGGKLYFKVGQGNKTDFEKYSSKPFVYTGHKGKAIEMSYWELPGDIMEDKNEILEWVEKSASQNLKKKRS